MSKISIELNSEGVRELLRSPEMLEICEELAQEIANSYGSNAEVNGYVGRNRVNASVVADSEPALEGNALLIATGGIND